LVTGEHQVTRVASILKTNFQCSQILEEGRRNEHRIATRRPLGGIIIEREPAVVEATDKYSPARPHIAEGGGELDGLAAVYGALVGKS
jgi:hypothetical protein